MVDFLHTILQGPGRLRSKLKRLGPPCSKDSEHHLPNPALPGVRESKGTIESKSPHPYEIDATKITMDFFEDQYCLMQKRNRQQCSEGDGPRSGMMLMACVLKIIFMLLSTILRTRDLAWLALCIMFGAVLTPEPRTMADSLQCTYLSPLQACTVAWQGSTDPGLGP